MKNRFKVLDIIDRVPDELSTEVHDIVLETGIKTIHKKKKGKKEKWLSEETIQIAVKRREAKSKGEKERRAHLNAEFQRIARRDKKAFLSEQRKEIEENNKMGKTRDLFKEIRDTKGIFHANMGSIMNRNGMELTLKKAEHRKIDAFELWCWRRLGIPLDCKEIQPVHPKGDQSCVFIGKTDAEAETPILWPPDGKNWLIGKDPDAGRDWGQEEKGTTEDKMAGWHHWLDGHEFE